MPNWTYGALVIKEGKEKTEEILKSFLSGIGTEEERVDFNILIPRPEDLNITLILIYSLCVRLNRNQSSLI